MIDPFKQTTEERRKLSMNYKKFKKKHNIYSYGRGSVTKGTRRKNTFGLGDYRRLMHGENS